MTELLPSGGTVQQVDFVDDDGPDAFEGFGAHQLQRVERFGGGNEQEQIVRQVEIVVIAGVSGYATRRGDGQVPVDPLINVVGQGLGRTFQ